MWVPYASSAIMVGIQSLLGVGFVFLFGASLPILGVFLSIGGIAAYGKRMFVRDRNDVLGNMDTAPRRVAWGAGSEQWAAEDRVGWTRAHINSSS